MDRLEKMMKLRIADHVAFSDEHKKLLNPQVVLTGKMDQLTTKMEELAEAQKHTEERLNALIVTVDGLIRDRPSL